MALHLKRTGAECRIPALSRGDGNPIRTGDVVPIPDRHASSFLQPDGTPDVGWALVPAGSEALAAPAEPTAEED